MGMERRCTESFCNLYDTCDRNLHNHFQHLVVHKYDFLVCKKRVQEHLLCQTMLV